MPTKNVIWNGSLWEAYDNGSGYYELSHEIRIATDKDIETYPQYTTGIQNF